jgi:hypothetical protein
MRKQFNFIDKVGNTCIVTLSENMLTELNNIRIGPILLEDNSYNSPMVLDETQAKAVAAYLLYFVMFNTIPNNENDYLEIIKQINDLQTFGKFYNATYLNNIVREVDAETAVTNELERRNR